MATLSNLSLDAALARIKPACEFAGGPVPDKLDALLHRLSTVGYVVHHKRYSVPYDDPKRSELLDAIDAQVDAIHDIACGFRQLDEDPAVDLDSLTLSQIELIIAHCGPALDPEYRTHAVELIALVRAGPQALVKLGGEKSWRWWVNTAKSRGICGKALKHLESIKPTSSKQLSRLTVAPRERCSCIFDVGYQLADPDSFEPMSPITLAEAESIRSTLDSVLAQFKVPPPGSTSSRDKRNWVRGAGDLLLAGGHASNKPGYDLDTILPLVSNFPNNFDKFATGKDNVVEQLMSLLETVPQVLTRKEDPYRTSIRKASEPRLNPTRRELSFAGTVTLRLGFRLSRTRMVSVDVAIAFADSLGATRLAWSSAPSCLNALQVAAHRQGFHLLPSGLFHIGKEMQPSGLVATPHVEDIYERLKLQYIPPEGRRTDTSRQLHLSTNGMLLTRSAFSTSGWLQNPSPSNRPAIPSEPIIVKSPEQVKVELAAAQLAGLKLAPEAILTDSSLSDVDDTMADTATEVNLEPDGNQEAAGASGEQQPRQQQQQQPVQERRQQPPARQQLQQSQQQLHQQPQKQSPVTPTASRPARGTGPPPPRRKKPASPVALSTSSSPAARRSVPSRTAAQRQRRRYTSSSESSTSESSSSSGGSSSADDEDDIAPPPAKRPKLAGSSAQTSIQSPPIRSSSASGASPSELSVMSRSGAAAVARMKRSASSRLPGPPPKRRPSSNKSPSEPTAATPSLGTSGTDSGNLRSTSATKRSRSTSLTLPASKLSTQPTAFLSSSSPATRPSGSFVPVLRPHNSAPAPTTPTFRAPTFAQLLQRLTRQFGNEADLKGTAGDGAEFEFNLFDLESLSDGAYLSGVMLEWLSRRATASAGGQVWIDARADTLSVWTSSDIYLNGLALSGFFDASFALFPFHRGTVDLGHYALAVLEEPSRLLSPSGPKSRLVVLDSLPSASDADLANAGLGGSKAQRIDWNPRRIVDRVIAVAHAAAQQENGSTPSTATLRRRLQLFPSAKAPLQPAGPDCALYTAHAIRVVVQHGQRALDAAVDGATDEADYNRVWVPSTAEGIRRLTQQLFMRAVYQK